jgi:uncharacterized protein (TIRG00374 family)
VTRIALVAGAIGLGLTVWVVGPSTIGGHLVAIGWWFAALLAVDATMTLCDAAAVHSLAGGPGGLSYPRVVVAQVAGRAVNAVTPGGNLGEALKASLLAEHGHAPRVVAAVLYVALTSFGVSLALISIGAPSTAVFLDLHGGLKVGLVVAGVIAAAVLITLVVLVRRGMLHALVWVAQKLRLVSKERRARWEDKLVEIDERLRGVRDPGRMRRATLFVLASKSLSWFSSWLIVAAAGYQLSLGELAALLSAGVVLGWLSTLVPMGLGIAEGGNYGLFSIIGAPPALGVSLALAKRVLQIVYSIIGFAVLAGYRVGQRRNGRSSVVRGTAT